MVKFFNKQEKPTISFVSTVPGLDLIPDIVPQPYKKFIPDWWKNTPAFDNNGLPTVKVCPSFTDFFDLGYVMPMWCSVKLEYNSEIDLWRYETSSSEFDIQHHGNEQFLDCVDVNFLGEKADFVFKAVCPWRIITKPGWSVLQLPLFYHFNKEYTVLPGIIDTDRYHQVNQQILYFGNSKQITINGGDPLCLYIPFERKKMDYAIRDANEHDIKIFNKETLNVRVGFPGSGRYRKERKLLEKKSD